MRKTKLLWVRLFFNAVDASNNPLGEVYLGDTPGFTLNVETESLDDYSSDGPIAEKHLSIATRITRRASLTCKNVSFDNLARFFIGTASEVAQTATPVVDENVGAVKVGRFYQLGVTTAKPQGVQDVTGVTITGAAGTPTFVLDTDYELDATNGRFKVLSAAMESETNVLVDYTPVAGTVDMVTSSNVGAQFGSLRYVGDETAGPNRTMFITRVQLKPSGEFAVKSRETPQQIGFEAEALVPLDAGQAALYVNGLPR